MSQEINVEIFGSCLKIKTNVENFRIKFGKESKVKSNFVGNRK
jgi:hypothetical protein